MSSHRDKSLPSLPACQSPLEHENSTLKDRIKLLESIIQVLYQQTLCYISVLGQRKDLEKGLKRTVSLCKNELKSLERQQFKIQDVEREAVSAWLTYCDNHNWDSDDEMGQCLEDIKNTLLQTQLSKGDFI
jgi:hypothetical protein